MGLTNSLLSKLTSGEAMAILLYINLEELRDGQAEFTYSFGAGDYEPGNSCLTFVK